VAADEIIATSTIITARHRIRSSVRPLAFAAAVAICGNNVASFSGWATDVVLLIVASFGYLLFRVARGIAKSA